MGKICKGVVAAVDWSKKRLVLRQEAGQGAASDQALSWEAFTRVSAPGRGLIPIQQLQPGQRICADCIQDQHGGWVARAIEFAKPQEPVQQ